MLATWSATEVAFLLIAIVQAVLAIVWMMGALLASTTRIAAIHWAVWSALSAVTWVIIAARLDSPPLIGVLAGVLGVMSLQRGIRIFIGRTPTHKLQTILLLVVVVMYWIGTHPATRYSQAAANFGVLSWLYFSIAHDLYRYSQQRLRLRWPGLLALPTLLGSIGFGSRALRALFWPESVTLEMSTNSSLNLASAIAFISLVLMFHATLMALVVSKLLAELRQLSHYDALTQLLNRRAMEETLNAKIQHGERSHPLVVMMLDLDHFKRINDRFGHAMGDLALKHVSAVLNAAMRDEDHLARFGGEEFIVLLGNSTLSQAEPIAERLRDLVTSKPLVHDDTSVDLSMSLGVAQWRGAGEDASQLLSRADAALFQAKVQGRNRVVLAVPADTQDSVVDREPVAAF